MGYTQYTVHRGDNLSVIALRHGTTVEVLARVNGMRNPDLIFPGQVLKVPVSASTAQTTILSEFICPFSSGRDTDDSQIEEYQQAVPLVLPESSGTAEPWTYEGLIDAYARLYGDVALAKLLFIVSKGGAGAGYEIHKKNMLVDGWDVDHDKKSIFIDEDQIFSGRTNQEAAKALHAAIEQEFEGKESFWQTTWRVTSGLGITALGLVEVGVGVIGIIIPEPSTTVAGVGLVVFGGSQVVEGVTRIANANQGKGYNPLEELIFAPIGRGLGGRDGESVARLAFAVTNLVVSLGGSYKILRVPGRPFLHKGTFSGSKMTYFKEGFTVGRLQLWYPMPLTAEVNSTGHLIINVVNNTNQWLFRFQSITTKTAAATVRRLVMNGRIVDVQNWHRVESYREMLKVLLKLAAHGFKKGL